MTSLFDIDKTQFLTPSSLTYELLILSEIQRHGFTAPPRSSFRSVEDTMVQAHIAKMTESKFVGTHREGGQTVLRLTPVGENRLRFLMVDYVQELLSLYGKAREVFRKRLADVYLEGVRRVVVYPPGETAEVIYAAMKDSGLELVGAVDDDPMKWDTQFHEVVISPPARLAELRADAVMITTCVFQSDLTQRVQGLNIPGLRVVGI